MKKILLILTVILALSGVGLAQVKGPDYKAGIGLRLGGGYYDLASASLKLFITQPGAVEFNLGIRPNSGYGFYDDWTTVSASASYQYHFPIGNIEGFKWFIGGGLTAYNSFSSDENVRGVGLGIFPTGGVEYKFSQIPLAVSADLRPTISVLDPYDNDFNGYHSFNAGNVGISARYTFK